MVPSNIILQLHITWSHLSFLGPKKYCPTVQAFQASCQPPAYFLPLPQFFWMDDEGSNQLLAEIPAGNPKVFNEIFSREEPPTPWDIKSCYLLLLLIWMNSLCPRLPFLPHIVNNNQSRWYRMCCFKSEIYRIYILSNKS